MSILSADNSFRKGLAALVDERFVEAAAFFLAAIEIDERRGGRAPEPRYLSYYGLSLAMAHGASPDALRACEIAADRDSLDPALHLNLGRLYSMAGQSLRALLCFRRGLELCPDHRALQREAARAESEVSQLGRRLRRGGWMAGLTAWLPVSRNRRGASSARAETSLSSPRL